MFTSTQLVISHWLVCKKMALELIVICCIFSVGFSPSLQQSVSPVRVTPSVLNNTSCAGFNYDSIKELVKKAIPYCPMCRCGPALGWTNVAHLDMSDSSQQCPDNLTLVTSPIRVCGRTSRYHLTCDSVLYPVHGRTYSRVCGRVQAYQTGRASAFYNSFTQNIITLELAYFNGVSLMHGPPGSRQHIWSFVNADHDRAGTNVGVIVCRCSFIGETWNYQVPSYIGNDYFCESSNPGPDRIDKRFFNDTLWDGLGCESPSCCELNTPPWFCKTLPAPTTNDIELRSCYGDDIEYGNLTITDVNIYVY